MKKIMIFAAFAALLSVASCQKEAVDNSVESPVFTATIAGDSKTTLNLSDGKIAWESNDEITVKDAASATAIYKIASIDPATGKATFVIKDGQTALGVGPYSATYGAEPSTSQTYSETAGKLYMTAPATETNSFTFTVACGLMKLNLTKAGESVKSVAVTGTPNGGSETTYTLNCSTAVSIELGANFCVALPDGSYTKIVITNSSDEVCTLDANSPVVVTNNHIRPVKIEESKITFQANIPEGALSGVFSVSPTKKVRFSKGNLYYNGTDFKFENNQYTRSTWQESHVGLFYWSKNVSEACADYYSDSFVQEINDVLFTNSEAAKAKPGFIVNGVEGKFRTLSLSEWKYLFNLEEVEGQYGYENQPIENGIRKDKFMIGLNVCFISDCTILLPDDWDESILESKELSSMNNNKMIKPSTWQKMENAGAVCLSFGGNSNGYFWASSIYQFGTHGYYCVNMAQAHTIWFYTQGTDGMYVFTSCWAADRRCVRLVTDVN